MHINCKYIGRLLSGKTFVLRSINGCSLDCRIKNDDLAEIRGMSACLTIDTYEKEDLSDRPVTFSYNRLSDLAELIDFNYKVKTIIPFL